MKFSEEHEWITFETNDNIGIVGISEHAVEQLGDITYVEFTKEDGDSVDKDGVVAVVESVKAASDVYTPVGGKIVEFNQELIENPELVKEAPHGAGWMFKIELEDASQLDGLMDKDGYEAFIKD